MTKVAAAVLLVIRAAGAAWAAPPAPLPESPAWVTISTEELRARYDTLWAVSDLHGRLQALEALLLAAGLAVRDEVGSVHWTPGRARQLLVVVGDCIDAGPDSVGVVFLLHALQDEAAAAGSRIVVLLGNHEVDFLANPRRASGELVSSASRAGLRLTRKGAGEQLAVGEFGRFLRAMPAMAFVGSWLFAHAGYLDADGEAGLRAYFSRLASSWAQEDGDRYRRLRDSRSVVSYHGWWRSGPQRSLLKSHLAALGLDGLVFGHDPGAFGAPATIAMGAEGWLTKLDTGLKTGRSGGMFLRCEVGRLVRGTSLAMSEQGKPTCRALTPDGAVHELPVR
jgi:hypothetical protein